MGAMHIDPQQEVSLLVERLRESGAEWQEIRAALRHEAEKIFERTYDSDY